MPLCVSAHREINEVAGELAHMSSQSKGHTRAPSASQMILQLGDMLEQKASQSAADAEAFRHERTKNALQLEHQAVGNLSAEVCILLHHCCLGR